MAELPLSHRWETGALISNLSHHMPHAVGRMLLEKARKDEAEGCKAERALGR